MTRDTLSHLEDYHVAWPNESWFQLFGADVRDQVEHRNQAMDSTYEHDIMQSGWGEVCSCDVRLDLLVHLNMLFTSE